MSQAAKYANYCNTTYTLSPSSPLNTASMQPNPGPPPTAHTAIVTCMDARLDPFSMFNLSLGEAHVIRVGGGRAPDALRSLIASQHVLAPHPREENAKKEIKESLGGKSVDWLAVMPLKEDLRESVRDDLEYLRVSPYLQGDKVSGWIYDTLKGTIEEVQ